MKDAVAHKWRGRGRRTGPSIVDIESADPLYMRQVVGHHYLCSGHQDLVRGIQDDGSRQAGGTDRLACPKGQHTDLEDSHREQEYPLSCQKALCLSHSMVCILP